MINQTAKKISISIVVTLALLFGMVAPVFAVTRLQISVIEVVPGGYVRLQVGNLPGNTEFTVRMGKAGGEGIGGGLVAHFNSGAGGTQEYLFEVHESVRNNSSVDVRIDDLAGTYGILTFNNSKAYPGGTTVATPKPSSATTTTTSVTGNLQVVNSQKGGWVKVLLAGLPVGKEFTVRIGMAGTRAANIYGYVVAHFTTDATGNQIGTFEVPFSLRNQASLDFRAESTGNVYVLTFANVDK
jgi:hypothetical protein